MLGQAGTGCMQQIASDLFSMDRSLRMDRLWRVRSRWMRADSTTYLGCPRNNQFFVSVQTEKKRNSICFGCFSVCFAKPKNFFPVCFGVLERYRNNQKPKQTELLRNKPKKSQKTLSFGVSSKQLFFWFEPKQTETQSV
jgi:hypothetical protein